MLETDNWTGPIHQERLLQYDGMPPVDDNKPEPGIEKPTEVSEEDSKSQDCDAVNEDLKKGEVSQITTSVEKENDKVSSEEPQNKVCDDDDAEDEEFKIKSLSDYIPSGHFLFLPPSRYVFPGAELYPEQDSSDDEDDAENVNENEGNTSTDNIDNPEGSEQEHEIVTETETIAATETIEHVNNQIFAEESVQESHQI